MLYKWRKKPPARSGGITEENPRVDVRLQPYMFKYINDKSQETHESMASIIRKIIHEKLIEESKTKGLFYEQP